MTEKLLLMLYGAIVIASGFLIVSTAILAFKEYLRLGATAAARSTYFWFAVNVCVQALAITLICFIRTVQGLMGESISGPWSWWLVFGFGLLLVSKIGFNWAATTEMVHGRLTWWSIVASLILWGVFVYARPFILG
jgi:hypothetical protein